MREHTSPSNQTETIAPNAPNAPNAPTPSTAPQPWKRLGERTITGSLARTQVRELLTTLLPSTVCPDGLLGTVEQAVLEAVARKQMHAGKEPLLIVSCLNTEGTPGARDKEQAGWSFFVIERPGPSSHDVIELCLYHE